MNLNFFSRVKGSPIKVADPEPVKVATHARHHKNAVQISYKGKWYTITEFADKAKVPYMTMYMRMKSAKSKKELTGEALLAPRRKGRPVEA